jgi:8-oxo-dGTP pyrophosphatase MutT (NUDIX family)
VLDFDPNRVPVTPRPAATILLLRDRSGELEVCVMQRSKQSSFMGGAVVFPGGRIEPADAAPEWNEVIERGEGAWWDDEGRAARVAACREALEEVGLAPIPGVTRDDLAALRKTPTPAALAERGRKLDLAALIPFSRWVTPEAESRRFDARFFLARAPEGVEPISDDHEAVRVLYASPSQLLAQFERDEIALFPPTHRSLELLAGVRSVNDAFALAASSSLEVICPRFLIDDGAPVLALPGDPKHEVSQRRVAGGSRYVLVDGRWASRDPVS